MATRRSKGTQGRVVSKVDDKEADAGWRPEDLVRLAQLKSANDALPLDAPRVLLSVRLSVLTDETTSPARQELDLREEALKRGLRVIGVASDLNVSATKVPPWKRKDLGNWIRNRAPEFDTLMFWKMDRFIRSTSDLMEMIKWCRKYDKGLMSVNDTFKFDLNDPMAEVFLFLIGTFAQIEAANTKMRVESMWQYAKEGTEFITGKPPFGYRIGTDDEGKRRLVFDEHDVMVIKDAVPRIMAGEKAADLVKEYKTKECGHATCPPGEAWVTKGSTSFTFSRKLKNPALMGYRVEVDMSAPNGSRVTQVFDQNGDPIRIADPILSQEEFDALQEVLAGRMRDRSNGRAARSRFLGVILCAECEKNLRVTINTHPKYGTKAYLRCEDCRGGGSGVHPNGVYEAVEREILTRYGDVQVQTREYARGEEARAKIADLKKRIEHYMENLEPGGRYTRNEFAQRRAEAAQDALIEELEAIDPESTEDRWILKTDGRTFRQHWQEGGMEAMEEDLRRVGVKVYVSRKRVKGQRQPEVGLRFHIPTDLANLLVRADDDFSDFA